MEPELRHPSCRHSGALKVSFVSAVRSPQITDSKLVMHSILSCASNKYFFRSTEICEIGGYGPLLRLRTIPSNFCLRCSCKSVRIPQFIYDLISIEHTKCTLFFWAERLQGKYGSTRIFSNVQVSTVRVQPRKNDSTELPFFRKGSRSQKGRCQDVTFLAVHNGTVTPISI